MEGLVVEETKQRGGRKRFVGGRTKQEGGPTCFVGGWTKRKGWRKRLVGAAPCTKTAAGYTATSTTGAPLFYLAEDGASLATALKVITSHLCCGCAQ